MVDLQASPSVNSEAKKTVYGSVFSDKYLLTNPESFPRYGHLARKAMMHYLGDRYNPHIDGLNHEVFVRQMIKEIIAYKVLYKTAAYDWEWIDHSFRKYFSGSFKIDLPYNQNRIDAGFHKAAKAPIQIDWSTVN